MSAFRNIVVGIAFATATVLIAATTQAIAASLDQASSAYSGQDAITAGPTVIDAKKARHMKKAHPRSLVPVRGHS
jgi:hypothetical protein